MTLTSMIFLGLAIVAGLAWLVLRSMDRPAPGDPAEDPLNDDGVTGAVASSIAANSSSSSASSSDGGSSSSM